MSSSHKKILFYKKMIKVTKKLEAKTIYFGDDEFHWNATQEADF